MYADLFCHTSEALIKASVQDAFLVIAIATTDNCSLLRCAEALGLLGTERLRGLAASRSALYHNYTQTRVSAPYVAGQPITTWLSSLVLLVLHCAGAFPPLQAALPKVVRHRSILIPSTRYEILFYEVPSHSRRKRLALRRNHGRSEPDECHLLRLGP